MSHQIPDHEVFEELAAGHVLHALEPADEQRFLSHAENCPDCARTIAGFREVAAALAETAPPAEPSAGLGERILAAALATPGRNGKPAEPGQLLAPGDAAPGDAGTRKDGRHAQRPATGAARHAAPSHGVLPHRRMPGPRWLRPVAAAAAVVLIAVGGVWAGLSATKSSPPQPAAFCAHPHACSQVAVTDLKTHELDVKVIVHDKSVWIEPEKLGPDHTSYQIYVLWQIAKEHPLAIGGFDIRAGVHTAIMIGPLVAPYSETEAFAVSLQHGRKLPTVPKNVVAEGLIS
jgi:anti-sigma-K factor RskA